MAAETLGLAEFAFALSPDESCPTKTPTLIYFGDCDPPALKIDADVVTTDGIRLFSIDELLLTYQEAVGLFGKEIFDTTLYQYDRTKKNW